MKKYWVLLILCWPVLGLAAPATVVLVENEAYVEQAGQKLPVKVGMSVAAGSAVTGGDGKLQLRMGDGTMLSLHGDSEVSFSEATQLGLVKGGLSLSTPSPQISWVVHALGRNIRASGYLKLQSCDQGCELTPGLYGRGNGGEVVVEYEGGRSSLRGKIFLLLASGGRPEIIIKAPRSLDGTPDYQRVEQARKLVLNELTQGKEAFQAGDFIAAKTKLEAVQQAAPSESIVSYYLGLIALNNQNNGEALRLLQKYTKDEPQGALDHDVPKTLTLLSSNQLQEEVSSAIKQEKSLATTPPEPNSIAVQTFSSRGDPVYQAMAKGIAAMIIADLNNVPGLKVLEREKVQKLMAEMALGDSGLSETATAVRTGRMMRAEKVIVGSFGVSDDK